MHIQFLHFVSYIATVMSHKGVSIIFVEVFKGMKWLNLPDDVNFSSNDGRRKF